MMLEVMLSTAAFTLSIITLGFSIRAWQLGDRRSRIPVLVFELMDKNVWVLRNIGNGPALNITVAWRDSHDATAPWRDPTRISPIPRDGSVQLKWFLDDMNMEVLGATYQDFLGADTARPGRTYTATCAHTLSRVRPGRHLPNWALEVTKPQWRREREALQASLESSR